jgi:hypothetical protein
MNHIRNERDITIKVIQENSISNRKLAEYFARKYEKEIQKIRLQKS